MAAGIEFLIEIWVLYAIGVLWLLLRLAVRLRTVGILALQLDDAFTLLVLASWTVNCVGIHITYYTGSAIGFVPSGDPQTRAYQLARAEYGAKLYFTTWYTYIMQLWCLKGTVLVFYRRLAIDRWQEILLKITTWFCAATFIGLMCVLTFSCFPYHENWQVWPRPPPWCSAKPKLLIATSCLNAFTDIMLLTIPVPLLWKLTLPPIKKACLVILLSSGIFVLAACITRVTLSVDPNVSLATIARWGTRELTIGIVAVNTAMLRPVIRKSFWIKKDPPAARQRNYVFATRNRVREIFSPQRAQDDMINSTSAGMSTIEEYNRQDSNDASVVFEDPDYQVVAQPKSAAHSQSRSRARSRSRSRARSQAQNSSLWGSFWNRSRSHTTSQRITQTRTAGPSQPPREVDLEKGEVSKDTQSSCGT